MGFWSGTFFRDVAAPTALIMICPLMLQELRNANLYRGGKLDWLEVAHIVVGGAVAVGVWAALASVARLARGEGNVVSDLSLVVALVAALRVATSESGAAVGAIDPLRAFKMHYNLTATAFDVANERVVTAWALAGGFLALQMVLIKLVPGRVVEGPVTSNGNVPTYVDNAFAVNLLVMGAFYAASEHLELFPASIAYDLFAELGAVLNAASLIVCALLFVKGHVAPSSSDYVVSGNPVLDFFGGIELYPRVLGFSVKQLSNVCFGMGSWPVLIASFAAAQKARHGFIADSMWVSLLLQEVYIAKFAWWVSGYYRSIDIHHDNAGFYLIWGCLCFVPGRACGARREAARRLRRH